MSLALSLTNYAFDKVVNLWGLAGKVLPLSPLVLRVRITNKCNLSCHYCYVGESLNKQTDNLLSVEEWQKVITHLSPRTLIDITGGEPFLTPGFDEIINSMLDKKLKVSLITNGTVYKKSLLQNLVDKKLSHFMISFDGNKELHEKVRGKGNFDRAIRTASELISYKQEQKSRHPLIVAKITVTEENHHDLEELTNYLLSEVGFNGVTLNLLFENSSRDGFSDGKELEDQKFWNGNTVVFSQKNALSMKNSIQNIRERFLNKVQVRPDISTAQLENYFLNPVKLSPVDCHKYRSIVTMYHDGTLTPCDIGLDSGNIRDIGYNVGLVHEHKKFRQFFQKIGKLEKTLPACQGCCLKKHEVTA